MSSHLLTVAGVRMVRMERVYQVFRAKDGMSVLCCTNEAVARKAFAKRSNNTLRVLDEYRGINARDYGHCCRVAVAEEGKP